MQETQEHIVQRALVNLLSPSAVNASNDAYERELTIRVRRRAGAAQRVAAAPCQPPPRRVSILEQPSAHALTVLWSDACSGHYAEQTWRLTYAKRDSRCALSGDPIFKGDEIFRPRVKRNALPSNWDRMILASKVCFREYAV
ncbi:DUF3331 domain-containing protein [Paraburkholderia youngii]|uniref:DUF3331 domain-containing protein n=1 Tax=Paraburkholderia youngii TaxID=2782701 RepID=A0A7Y6K083_9BURK|nr:DUF3331 domain-containing protein [Paraburkholderia youngii]